MCFWVTNCPRIDTLTKAVMTMVIQRLDYCNAVLCGASQRSIAKLQVAQNCAARLITNIPRRKHITPTLKNLHWLPVLSRIDFKVLVLTHKALNADGSPSYMKDMFTPVYLSHKRGLRSTSDTSILSLQRTHNTYGDRAFSNYAAKLWNGLPSTLRQTPQLNSFKSKLKTYLFVLHFGAWITSHASPSSTLILILFIFCMSCQFS